MSLSRVLLLAVFAQACAGKPDIKAKPPRDACFCTAIYAPVCGEDGRTYSNRCQAESCNGVKVVSDGPCVIPPEDACCNDGPLDNQFCCGTACLAIGTPTFAPCGEPKCCPTEGCSCPKDEIEEPYCGSDGVTYECKTKAKCAGVKDGRPGACDEVDVDPGCTKELPKCACGACLTADDAELIDCGPLTENKSCIDEPPSPTICPEVFAPVCGTDGETYSNACFAGKQPLACEGECPCDAAPGCTAEAPICFCGRCITLSELATAICSKEDADKSCGVPPPPPSKCCPRGRVCCGKRCFSQQFAKKLKRLGLCRRNQCCKYILWG